MEETLSVATRVAEEAIDEAISNAEFDTSTQVIYVFPIFKCPLAAVIITH